MPAAGPPCSSFGNVTMRFQELSSALSAYLSEITERLIREEVHGETADAEERDEPKRLAK